MFITPDWPVPENVKALCTTRQGGVSVAPFDSFNMATHVGDDLNAVIENRALLQQQANLPSQPIWLDQQHTDIAINLDCTHDFDTPPIADASWTTTSGVVSVVMTADCLPVLLVDQTGSCVAAIHAGWKGLADGIVSKTVAKLPVAADSLMAWIGPAISKRQFEVGQDVYDAFVAQQADNQVFFTLKTDAENKYLADLPGLVNAELNRLGVIQTYQSNLCSYEDSERFYSYRRDGQTGRMASMIWIENG